MTRDEIFAAITAWTKARLDPMTGRPADRRAWITAEDGVSAMLAAKNDAGWLSIIEDAKAGARLKKLLKGTAIEYDREGLWWVTMPDGCFRDCATTPGDALRMALEKVQPEPVSCAYKLDAAEKESNA